MRSVSTLLCAAATAAALSAQSVPNDGCLGAIPIYAGVNPSAPSGAGGSTFSNVGASASAGFVVDPGCTGSVYGFNRDVFFAYAAAVGGPTAVATCTPPGFAPGTEGDTVVEVYESSVCPGGGTPIACADEGCLGLSSLTFTATQGATYYVRVGSWAQASPGGTFYVTVTPPAIANDDCAGATSLPADGPYLGSTYGASDSGAAGSCGQFTAGVVDVWHVVVPAFDCDATFTLSGPGADRLELRGAGGCGAGATTIACGTTSISAQLGAGLAYYVRVGRPASTPGLAYVLSTACVAGPPNDGPAGAIDVLDGVNPSSPGGVSGSYFTNVGATTGVGHEASPPCVAAGHPGGNDVYFRYVATATGPCTVSTCTPAGFAAGTLGDTILQAFAGLGGPEVACDDDACGVSSSATFAATSGTTYYFRVSSWLGELTSEGSFYLTVSTVPSNDLCVDAIPLPPFGPTNAIVLNGSTANATPTPALGYSGIFYPTDLDVWYSLTPATSCDVSLNAFNVAGAYVGVYAGGCAAPTVISSGELAAPPVRLSAGEPYLIRVARDVGAPPGLFQVAVACAPNEDVPAGAVALYPGINPAPPAGANGQMFSTVGASPSPSGAFPPNLGDPSSKDVFFTYVPASTAVTTISACVPAGFAGPTWDGVLAAWDGSDLVAVDDDFCANSGLPSIRTALVAGHEYLIRVAGWSGDSAGSFYLSVQPEFSLTMWSPNGPGTLRVDNGAGPPNQLYLTVLTLTQGTYPNGWFYGVSPAPLEIFLQLATGGPPFLGALDAAGGSQFEAPPGLPALTLYGVTLTFDAAGGFLGATPPTRATIL